MSWHKRDDDYESNPKIVAAGRDGAVVFAVLLGINSRFGCCGVLAASHWSVALVRARLGVFGMPAGRVMRALDACMRAGLVRDLGEGQLGIVGYDEEWSPKRASLSNSTDPVESASKCGRCGKRVQDGEKRCQVCAAQDARRDRRRFGAGLAQPVAQIGAGLAQPVAQIGAGLAQPAPSRARASGSGDGEREEEGDRSLSGELASTPRARAAAPERASPFASLQGEPEPEPDPDSYADPDAVANELPPEHRAGYLASLARIRAEKSQRREPTQNGTAIDATLARGVYGEGKP